MPGGLGNSVGEYIPVFLLFSGYPTVFTALSGYCLHRVKRSSRIGTNRIVAYGLAYLAFAVPNLPLYLMWELGGDPFPLYFYPIATALLFGTLRLSPPDKGRRMLIPAVLVFAFLLGFCLKDIPDIRRRIAERDDRRNKEQAEYDSAMTVLSDPAKRIRPEGSTERLASLSAEFIPDALHGGTTLPIPAGYAAEPIPDWYLPRNRENPRIINRLFTSKADGGRFFVLVMQGYEPKSIGTEGGNVPYLEGSVYEHFRKVFMMYFHASYMLQEFMYTGPEDWKFRKRLLIPSDEKQYGDDRERVVLYTDTIIASGFPGTILPERRDEGEAMDFDFTYAAFHVGKTPVHCLVAIDRQHPTAEANMAIMWIEEFKRINP